MRAMAETSDDLLGGDFSNFSEEHRRIIARLVKLDGALKHHVDEVHADVMSRTAIEKSLASNAEALSAVTDALAGRISPLTGDRVLEEGIAYKVDILWRQSQNGGIKSKLATGDRAAIYGAIALYVLQALGIVPDLTQLGTIVLGLFS